MHRTSSQRLVRRDREARGGDHRCEPETTVSGDTFRVTIMWVLSVPTVVRILSIAAHKPFGREFPTKRLATVTHLLRIPPVVAIMPRLAVLGLKPVMARPIES